MGGRTDVHLYGDGLPAADTAWERGLTWYESNTGVEAGVSLTSSGSITVSSDGTTVEAKDITGSLNINAENVTIRNCRVTGDIQNLMGTTDQNVLIEHCEVISSVNSRAIHANIGVTVRRCKVYNGAQLIYGAGYTTIEDCWLYDIKTSSQHAECVLSNGDDSSAGQYLVVQRCWMACANTQSGQDAGAYVSGAVCMYGDWGQQRNNTVVGNHMTGTGYLLYPGAVSSKPYPLPYNVEVTGNTFDPDGYGPVYPSALDSLSESKWARNTLSATGATVSAPTGNG